LKNIQTTIGNSDQGLLLERKHPGNTLPMAAGLFLKKQLAAGPLRQPFSFFYKQLVFLFSKIEKVHLYMPSKLM
jgi:hypothetical protein